MVSRTVVQGTQRQGIDEAIAYEIDVTNWGDSPSNASVKVYSVTGDTFTDVTITVMPTGVPTVTGNKIKLPLLKSLTQGVTYRVELKFEIVANTLEAHFLVLAER